MAATPPVLPRFYESLPLPLGAAIFLVQVALGVVLFAVFQEYVPNEIGTSDAWGGYLLAVYGMTRFLAETPTGAISDALSRKWALLAGFTFMLPVVAFMGFIDTQGSFIAVSILMGLATAFVWPATYAIGADLYPPHQRGKVVGFLNVAQFLGFGLGALIGALLVENFPVALFVAAALAVATGLVVTLAGIPQYRSRDLPGMEREDGEGRPKLREVVSWRIAFLAFLILLSTTSVAVVVPVIRPYGEDDLGISFAALTLYLMPVIIIGGILYIPAGHVADRFGRTLPMFFGQVAIVAGGLIVASTTTIPVAVVGAGALVAGQVFAVPAMNAAMMDLAPEPHRGALIGLSVALSGLGLGAGPAIGGFLVDAEGPQTGFFAAAVIGTVAAAGVLTYRWAFQPHPGPNLALANPARDAEVANVTSRRS